MILKKDKKIKLIPCFGFGFFIQKFEKKRLFTNHFTFYQS